jgi:prolyl-tRNA editing enzyme YbaK/EbsC (Cys-tRNA(Pro) deacylase)
MRHPTRQCAENNLTPRARNTLVQVRDRHEGKGQMSKSLKRVKAALQDAGITVEIMETEGSRTAEDAARAVGCVQDQIVKSLIFKGAETGRMILFLTAGGKQLVPEHAQAVAGEALDRADANDVRTQTGFAIGGVSPVGHLSPVACYMDETLMGFDTIWAAAGTPRHVFAISPDALRSATGAEVADFAG